MTKRQNTYQLVVVLVKLSVLAQLLARKTPMSIFLLPLALHDIFNTPMARHSLFVLKVPLSIK